MKIFRFGGIGGNGGNVIAVTKPDITLENVYKKNRTKVYKAPNGRHASHNFIIGQPGEDLVIDVPIGVTFITEWGKKLGKLQVYARNIIFLN